jgi:TldD protein
MRDFALSVLSRLDGPGLEYADVRAVSRRAEHYRVKNGVLEARTDEEDLGFGVRVLADGFWGFAASHELTETEAARVASDAVRIARASAAAGGDRVRLAPQTAHTDMVTGPCEEDPFVLSAEEKIAFLLEATAELGAPGVSFTIGNLGALRETKVFVSTEGAVLSQSRAEAGGGISAVAIADGDVQTRSYPSAGPGSWRQGGFEVVRAMGLVEAAPRLAEEVVALLSAPRCPSATTTVILDSDQVALQVHESVGHPTELDRVLGSEASYAGTSFLSPDDTEHLTYGSHLMTITADATTPGGLGTAPYDDEGVPAKKVALVERGRLRGFQTSRETASGYGVESSGAMRAAGWNRIPLVRMTNINLEAGQGSLADLIADTDQGVLMSTNKSWSIDDRRLNFHFATEIGWEIKRGKVGKILRECTYTGVTPTFWGSLDAVCGPDEWRLFGVTNCGKGEPGQTVHVGHGASPARFRNVRVGEGGT